MKKLFFHLGVPVIILILIFFIYGVIRYFQLYDSQSQDIASIGTRALNIITSTMTTSNIKNQTLNIKNSPEISNPKSQPQITQIKPETQKPIIHNETLTTTPDIDDIVTAICLVESDNRSRLRGHDGERGIMQIRKNEWRFTCKKLLHVNWSWDEAFDKRKNIAVGRAYIKYLIKKYGDWELSVRVYNAGYHGVTVHNRGNKYLANVKKVMKTGNTMWRHKKSKK